MQSGNHTLTRAVQLGWRGGNSVGRKIYAVDDPGQRASNLRRMRRRSKLKRERTKEATLLDPAEHYRAGRLLRDRRPEGRGERLAHIIYEKSGLSSETTPFQGGKRGTESTINEKNRPNTLFKGAVQKFRGSGRRCQSSSIKIR